MQVINWKVVLEEKTPPKNSTKLLENSPCPICKSKKLARVFSYKDFQFFSDNPNQQKRVTLSVNKCRMCNCLYLGPRFSNEGFKILFEEAGQSYGSLSNHIDEQIKWIYEELGLKPGQIVLDVGCYDGEFLSRLNNDIIKLGLDIDKPAIERARKKFVEGRDIFINGDFETFEYSLKPPNIITMFHVLEHLSRPVEVLKKLLSISNESTVILIEVPTIEDGLTNDINGFFSVQHTNHFSRFSLKRCLIESGWTPFLTHECNDYNGYRIAAKPNKSSNNNHLLANYAVREKENILLNKCLSKWYESISKVQEIMANKIKSKKILIWGAGFHTELLFQLTSLFESNSIQFAIVDSDILKQNKTWRGINIYDPKILRNLDWNDTSLLISSYSAQEPIYKAALSLSVPKESIVKLYEYVRRY